MAKTPGFPPTLGIDIGSLYLKIVRFQDGQIRSSLYEEHQGQPFSLLSRALPRFLNGDPLRVGITGALAHTVADSLALRPIETESSLIRAVKQRAPDVRNIIDIGGASLSLIRLNASGELEGLSRNSLCAAGTGSFLDEQAARLGISYDDPDAMLSVEDPPVIATRCAVFAKSDLIHHQQKGRTRAECWSGLCQGMVRTLLNALLKGRRLQGLTAVVGGVSRNREILRRLMSLYGEGILHFDDGHIMAACGAALLARDTLHPSRLEKCHPEGRPRDRRELAMRPPLTLNRSIYPSWDVLESYTDEHGTEVRVSRVPPTGILPCFLGIDIGSTSTKLAVIDGQGDVILDAYRKTGGDPLEAVKLLFAALLDLGCRRRFSFEVLGCATTGSGRKMVGMIVGADRIVNEITCHVTGAARVEPGIDTIFEIGGQDSKYVRTRDGKILDAAMNYVCAAGTGSFVEELARKLGYSVQEVGPAVMGIAPPHTSDRCTVFMEQDVNHLLSMGSSKEEALAAVLYSVVQNYLYKVVGNRGYSSEKIFFQGATARNPALVAAFENLLGVEMVVSPYAHVMGAWGAALIARQSDGEGKWSRFKGLDLSRRKVSLRNERCRLCANDCEITYCNLEGESAETSWGYLCGREPQESRVRDNPHFRFFRLRETLFRTAGLTAGLPEDAPLIAIPASLTSHTYLPLWRGFFGALGCKVRTSGQTNGEIKKLGAEVSGGEFCFPVKAALGHARWLAENGEAAFLFVPHMVAAPPNGYTTNSYFCPYVQSFPSLVRASLGLHGIDTTRILAPVIDFRWKTEIQITELFEKLGCALEKDRRSIERAWEAGCAAQLELEKALWMEGEEALRAIGSEGRPAILILGRPYNTYDAGVNLGLVRKIAELGFTVLPLDLFPSEPSELGEALRNMYWGYAQKILQAVKRIRGSSRIFPVYFTNFNCGPDSFVESYARYLLGDKPMLVLALDEHDADAGYITRIEAFLDVVKSSSAPRAAPEVIIPSSTDEDFRKRTIWIPNMHPAGAPLFAAGFRSFGYRAEVLPLESAESFEIGRSLTSGSECLPTAATIGVFVKKLTEIGARPGEHALFMPTTSGPCRFGQYALKQRMILNGLGYSDIPILSPSAANSYQGLSQKLRRRLFNYVVASDILLKLRCRTVPYARDPARALGVFVEEIAYLVKTIDAGGNFAQAFVRALERLGSLQVSGPQRPLVGIVGEIYVRSNAFTNAGVIDVVERYGGEAWLAPLSEWFLYTAHLHKWRSKKMHDGFLRRGVTDLKNRYMRGVEKKMYRLAARWMRDRHEPDIAQIVGSGLRLLPLDFEGESILTVGRAIEFIRAGAGLVVNCAPFGCMPGTITSALLQKVQTETGVPVVSIFYDGEGELNSILKVYLHQILRVPG